jgi:hypothetical protein
LNPCYFLRISAKRGCLSFHGEFQLFDQVLRLDTLHSGRVYTHCFKPHYYVSSWDSLHFDRCCLISSLSARIDSISCATRSCPPAHGLSRVSFDVAALFYSERNPALHY